MKRCACGVALTTGSMCPGCESSLAKCDDLLGFRYVYGCINHGADCDGQQGDDCLGYADMVDENGKVVA